LRAPDWNEKCGLASGSWHDSLDGERRRGRKHALVEGAKFDAVIFAYGQVQRIAAA
jgi:hypothetical protein